MKIRWLTILVVFCTFLSVSGASPWDSWRRGYIAYEQAEQLAEKGNYTEALEQFKNSKKSYLEVRKARPDWNQRVIAERLADCDAKIKEISGRLGQKKTPQKKAPAAAAVSGEKKNTVVSAETSTDDGADAKLRQQIILLEAELSVYKKQIAKRGSFEKEIADLVRDKRIASERYTLLEQRYKKLREESAAPERELTELKKRIVEEKMRAESAERRTAVAEQRLKESSEDNKNNQLARSAELKLRQKAEEELSRLRRRNQELTAELAQQKTPGTSPVSDPANPKKSDKNGDTLAAVSDSLQKANNRIASLTEDNQRLLKESQSAAQDASLSKSEAARYRERNRALEQDVKKLFERCEALNKRLSARESDDFKTVAAAKEERGKLEQQLLNLQNEIVKYRADAEAKKGLDKDLERKTKALEAELLTVRTKLAVETKRAADAAAENEKMREMASQYETLQRNFKALSAENQENKALAAAAKPREAELEKIKLRLLESDRLRSDLAREQRLNEELKKEHLRLAADLRAVRQQLKELDSLRRRNAELEPALREVERLKKLQSSYQLLNGRESELSALKIKLAEIENQLRVAKENANAVSAENESLKKRNDSLNGEIAALSRLQRVNDELRAVTQSQTAEIDRLTAAGNSQKTPEKMNDAQRQTEQKITALHTQINQLQDELSRSNQQLRNNQTLFKRQLDETEKRSARAEKMIQLKERAIADLQKLNRELADYRNHTADKLRQQSDDSARIKLEEELTVLTKLNAKLAAERDLLQRQLEAARNGVELTDGVPGTKSPEELSASGLEAERHGNTELALWNYRQALETSPHFAPAHQRIGIILYSRGDYKAALPHLSAAYAAATENFKLALITARCQIALKRYGSAKAIIDPLQRKQPDSWQLQLLSGLIEAGTGRSAVAEERMMLAARQKPDSAEVQLELARLLAHSISDRSSEGVLAYEKARQLGAAPDPELEQKLGSLLDHRRELIRFLSGAAGEAELHSDWGAAVWYYRKLLEMKRPEFVPRMALAQFRMGKTSAARETLEFNAPSRLGMAVASLIDLESGNTEGALRNAGQAAGAKLPPDWVGMKMELEKLAKGSKTPAVNALQAAFQR